MKKIETLVIRGRRWFQKLYGNTYHTVTVVVNGRALKSSIQYGYGNQYLVTAVDLLRENGYDIQENNIEALRSLILHFLFTGESEYIQFAGKYNISLYDEFSQELENKLIDEFYSLNQKQFRDDLENFTDYFLSEHTILLKTYIYDILDSFTAEKLKCIIFK